MAQNNCVYAMWCRSETPNTDFRSIGYKQCVNTHIFFYTLYLMYTHMCAGIAYLV